MPPFLRPSRSALVDFKQSPPPAPPFFPPLPPPPPPRPWGLKPTPPPPPLRRVAFATRCRGVASAAGPCATSSPLLPRHFGALRPRRPRHVLVCTPQGRAD